MLNAVQGKTFDVESITGKVLGTDQNKSTLPVFIFGNDGKLSGHSGCNNFNGNYKIYGNKASFNAGAMTKMFCPESTEADFLNALRQVTGIRLDGNKLKLLNGSDELMILVERS